MLIKGYIYMLKLSRSFSQLTFIHNVRQILGDMMQLIGLVVLLMLTAIDASSDSTQIYWVGIPEPTTENFRKIQTTTARPTSTTTTKEPYYHIKNVHFEGYHGTTTKEPSHQIKNVRFDGYQGRGVAYWFPTSSSLRASGSLYSTPPTLTTSTTTLPTEIISGRSTTTTTTTEVAPSTQTKTSTPDPNTSTVKPAFVKKPQINPFHIKYYPIWRLNVLNGTTNDTTNVSLNVTTAEARHTKNKNKEDKKMEDAVLKLMEQDPKGTIDTLWRMLKTFYECLRDQWSSGKVMSCIAKRTLQVVDTYLNSRYQEKNPLFNEPRKMIILSGREEEENEEDEEEDEEDDQDQDDDRQESNEISGSRESEEEGLEPFKITSAYLHRGSRRKGHRKRKKDRLERLKYFHISKHILPIFYSIGLTVLTLKAFSLFLMAATSGKALLVSVVALTVAIANVMKKVSHDANRRTDSGSSINTSSLDSNSYFPGGFYDTRRLGYINATEDEAIKKNKYFM